MSLFDDFEQPQAPITDPAPVAGFFGAPEGDSFTAFDAPSSPQVSAFSVPSTPSPQASPSIQRAFEVNDEDSPILKAWKEKHKAEVEKRKAESEARQQKAVAEGAESLKRLYAEREKLIAENKARNKQAEEDQKAIAEAAAKGNASVWQTVAKYVDLNGEVKTEKDTSRLREILASLARE